MNNLITVLIASIKAKILPLVTKVKLWMNWSFIQARGISKIREFFGKILSVKPRHKKDYYGVLGWLISKRLVIAVVIAVGIISLIYLVNTKDALFPSSENNGVKEYNYDSIMLRFADDKVRILGKSGYLAYEGYVSSGAVTGTGTLYNPQGNVVYQGQFVSNKYDGMGTSYYPDGIMEYNGQFSQNLFNGTGKQYRTNGSISYEGEFSMGKREGRGILYNNAGTAVYTGNFSQDQLLYQELLGKSVSEMTALYTGDKVLYSYEKEGEQAIYLKDIGAVCTGHSDEESLDEELVLDNVVVMKDNIVIGSQKCKSIADLEQVFGAPDYQGASSIILAEAIAANELSLQADILYGSVSMDSNTVYTEYIEVSELDENYTVYLYSFHRDGVIYNFICKDSNSEFVFYTIEKEEGGDAA